MDIAEYRLLQEKVKCNYFHGVIGISIDGKYYNKITGLEPSGDELVEIFLSDKPEVALLLDSWADETASYFEEVYSVSPLVNGDLSAEERISLFDVFLAQMRDRIVRIYKNGTLAFTVVEYLHYKLSYEKLPLYGVNGGGRRMFRWFFRFYLNDYIYDYNSRRRN